VKIFESSIHLALELDLNLFSLPILSKVKSQTVIGFFLECLQDLSKILSTLSWVC